MERQAKSPTLLSFKGHSSYSVVVDDDVVMGLMHGVSSYLILLLKLKEISQIKGYQECFNRADERIFIRVGIIFSLISLTRYDATSKLDIVGITQQLGIWVSRRQNTLCGNHPSINY